MVNDCSTDGSDKIIDEYDEKYDCCKAIHLEKNSGGAHGPRNRGIEAATGNYIMFLDPDDDYTVDACETLYKEIKENDADIAFARFRRIFSPSGKVQKSYSPFKDDLESIYPDEILEEAIPLPVSEKLWNTIFETAVYGRFLSSHYEKGEKVDKIKIKSINEELDLLKISPSIWCNIYKRDLIIDNNIRFKPYVTGDDTSFNLETLLKADGIVYLNNFISYNYYVRDSEENKSLTNVVNLRALKQLMEGYIYCARLCRDLDKRIAKLYITPSLLYWFYLWKNSPFTKKENRILLKKVNTLKIMHNKDLKSRLILSAISTSLETAIHTKKR